MSSPKVTAIIVSYCSKDTIGAVLTSFRKAHDTGLLDCIVVDNASSDGTAPFIKQEHPWVTLLESRENLGYGRACNLALQHARTPYVMFMNADTTIEPDSLATLIHFMEEHPQAGVAAPALVEMNGHLQGAGALPTPSRILAQAFGLNGGRPGQFPIRPGDAPVETEWLCGAMLLVARDLLDEMGGFDPRFFLYYEEADLCRRARAHGRQLWAVGTALARHAGHHSAAQARKELYEGCIAEHFFPSRFYYLAKYYGWLAAAATEVCEIALLAAHAVVSRLHGHCDNRFFLRLRAPLFHFPRSSPVR